MCTRRIKDKIEMYIDTWDPVLTFRRKVEIRLIPINSLLKLLESIESPTTTGVPDTFLTVGDYNSEKVSDVIQLTKETLANFKVMLEKSKKDPTFQYSARYSDTLHEFLKSISTLPETATPIRPFVPITEKLPDGKHDHRNRVMKLFFSPPPPDLVSETSPITTFENVLQYYIYLESTEVEAQWMMNPQTAMDIERFNVFWQRLYALSTNINSKLFSLLQNDIKKSHETLAIDGVLYYDEHLFLLSLSNGDVNTLRETHDRLMVSKTTPLVIYNAMHKLYLYYTNVYVNLKSLDSTLSTITYPTIESLEKYVKSYISYNTETRSGLEYNTNIKFHQVVVALLEKIRKNLVQLLQTMEGTDVRRMQISLTESVTYENQIHITQIREDNKVGIEINEIQTMMGNAAASHNCDPHPGGGVSHQESPKVVVERTEEDDPYLTALASMENAPSPSTTTGTTTTGTTTGTTTTGTTTGTTTTGTTTTGNTTTTAGTTTTTVPVCTCTTTTTTTGTTTTTTGTTTTTTGTTTTTTGTTTTTTGTTTTTTTDDHNGLSIAILIIVILILVLQGGSMYVNRKR
jgi:hypothetical protein